ncbi:N-acetylneuraminate lyase-like isoform X2 [Phymastichus coffea]|uniref:N-acetylneuraminate lyase-like isoform X2 n=1 Tax=Phymastichus coffea TaxID=108790 RepID=UPI00273ADAC2|nr:N-acetylneuraminate lyase-like isoform X2 [Phymastichus coffea]
MKTISFSYKGLIVPVFTPINNNESRSLNLSIVPDYARYLKSKKINGILVNGSTGEGTSLTVEERKSITEAWASTVKETSQHLMVQVGGAPLKDVEQLATHAENIGADSILCLPELYFKPTTVCELTEYLRLVGESAPKTPLFYYDFPKASNVNVDMGQLLKSASGKIPTFAGIKTDLERAVHAKQVNDNYNLFLAGDMMMLSGCAVGMESYIMTTLNFLQEPALELIEFGSWVSTMKIAMSITTDLFMGPPRAPLKLLSQESIEAMNKGLTNLGIETNKTALLKML